MDGKPVRKGQPLQMQPGDEFSSSSIVSGLDGSKSSQQRVGPLQATMIYGKGSAYKLELPGHWKIYLVLSIEHLGPSPVPSADPFKRPIPNKLPAINEGAHSD